MVLENVSVSQEDSFSETPPSSDADPYAGNSPEYRDGKQPSYLLVSPSGYPAVYVNINKLPRPFSLSGSKPFPPPAIPSIKQLCDGASSVLQRPVTQDEADALAFGLAKSMRIASYGSPIGVALGAIQSYRTRPTYGFPFWKPMKEGGRFSPEVFGPVRGPFARVMWHSARMSAYLIVGALMGQIFFGSYALSVASADRARDPRLKELTKATHKRLQERTGIGAAQRQAEESDGPRKGETFEMARQRRSVQRTGQNEWGQQGSGRARGDDMSPTGGAFQEDFANDTSDAGLLDDNQLRRQDSRGRMDSGSADGADAWMQPAGDYVPSSRQNERTSSHQNQWPSRGQQPDQAKMTDTSPNPPQQGGSAWDRLRRNAVSDQKISPEQPTRSWQRQSEPRSSSTRGGSDDSYSFSPKDEDRQLAKSEAQREFDARLEREREGKNFDDKGGWRK